MASAMAPPMTGSVPDPNSSISTSADDEAPESMFFMLSRCDE